MPPIWYGSNNDKRFTLAKGRFYYSGFVDSHGILFEDFRAAKGRVYSVVVFLVCNVLVGTIVGGTLVTDVATVRHQVIALAVVHALRFAWLVAARPFLVPAANWLEAVSTLCQIVCVVANVWALPPVDCAAARAAWLTPAQACRLIYWTMLASLVLLALRVVAMSVPQLCRMPRTVHRATVAGAKLRKHARAERERRLIPAHPSIRPSSLMRSDLAKAEAEAEAEAEMEAEV